MNDLALRFYTIRTEHGDPPSRARVIGGNVRVARNNRNDFTGAINHLEESRDGEFRRLPSGTMDDPVDRS
jgi:hypothetical protein